MNAHFEAIQGPVSAKKLGMLRDIDDGAYDALISAMPLLSDYIENDIDLADLAGLLLQIATEMPEAARAFAHRIGSDPALVGDYHGLRRWAVHGLQKHRNDIKRMLHHFERGSPHAFSDEQSANDTEELLLKRGALLHYLAGFGFGDFSIDLHEPEVDGGHTHSVTIEDGVIRFPRCPESGTVDRTLLLRANIAHAAAHLRHSPLRRPIGNRRPSLVAMTALVEDARVERLMVIDYPGLRALWGAFHTATHEVNGFDFAGLSARLARALHDDAYIDANPWVSKGRELFDEAVSKGLDDVQAFDRLARMLAIELGKMRIEPLSGYRPQPIYRDDNAILWGPDTALPEDSERHSDIEIVDALQDGEKAERDVEGIDVRLRYRYPEWDHRLSELREGWATVVEEELPRRKTRPSLLRPAQPRITLSASARVPDRAIRLTRLTEGDEIDLNVVVENVVQQRARLSPDGRIFCRHGRRRRSTSVVLLMDFSISTERFVPGSFTKVIDVEKQAALVIAEAMEAQHDRIAIHGFSSNGRHEVNYRRIKDFDEPFGEEARSRLAASASRHSTRMGAAIRHATALLEAEAADHKVVLLLTDGEPSDIDVAEDDYLVEDAREAVVSGLSQRVRTFCVTLDRRADHYARRIFGQRNFLITERASTFANNTNRTLTRLLAL
ncbi:MULTISPECIES: nitric oxide reductase activation protein NorD [unclassified Shinella]|uniref:nitric oxide reductase activation protein NorD n=1 Tax=unclassified Shinella TaxID=2643062 RepID=UPI00225C9169|nr:VWA domain-containing protein [Shinella sp. YE25]MDC7259726.1 VWA domain-containing protein [Shinella sp. YE25]CAI0333932.1 VWA domain-containing protein [Rhizobiaceae bacterium]CAK7261573.1 nitric oxide reductase NorD protein [Shinella sp. WSC3-e]